MTNPFLNPKRVHQILFLATYLASAHRIDIDTHPETYVKDTKPLNLTKISTGIISCKTTEELYEYLEDFAFITDPWFDLYLTLLLETQP